MDDSRFDELVKGLGGSSRRSLVGAAGAAALAALFGLEGADEALAKRKKKGKGKNKRKKDRKPPEPCGGDTVCTGGQFCCDDQREFCCAQGDSCCNIGPGTGFCCSPPDRCARPVGGDDDAPFECCPPERQWFTSTGLVRCCPEGSRSLGTDISSDDGPCCPEEKYCSEDLTGGKCCPDLVPVCIDPAMGTCCTDQDAVCGTKCCAEPFGECCNGECWYSEDGPWTPCGDICCWAGTTCCGEGAIRVCCEEGLVCRTPCGNLDAACCHPEAVNCCNTECPPEGCGG